MHEKDQSLPNKTIKLRIVQENHVCLAIVIADYNLHHLINLMDDHWIGKLTI